MLNVVDKNSNAGHRTYDRPRWRELLNRPKTYFLNDIKCILLLHEIIGTRNYFCRE